MRGSIFVNGMMVALCVAGFSSIAGAQERRRSADGPPPPPPTATPMRHRAPFAGVWLGARLMKNGAEPSHEIPTTMVFDADSAGTTYTGYQVFPNGGRGPYDGVRLQRGTMTWKHANSGGGSWIYSARLVGNDTLVGTVVLKDWPQGDGAEPSGTFTLVRQRP